MRYAFLLMSLVSFLPIKIFAQQKDTDITGLWKGTLYNDTLQQFYQYEIGISEEDGKLSGFSHTWFILDDKQYFGIKKLKVKRQDGKIIVEDAGLIANNYPVEPAKNIRQLNILVLNTTDSVMTLTGPFTTNATKKYRPLTGTINLQRRNDYWQSALVPHLQELNLVKNLSFVKEDFLAAKNEVIINVQQASAPATKLTVQQPLIKKVDVKNPVLIAKAAETITVTSTAKVATTTPGQNIKNVPEEHLNTAKFLVQKDEGKPLVMNAKTAEIATPITSPKDLINHKSDTVYAIAAARQPEKKRTIPTNTAIIKEQIPTPTISAVPTLISKAMPAFEVMKRTTQLQQTVSFKSDSLQISLYDNGEIDGDTVSVLMNGTVIMAKERLSTNAVRKTIFIPQNTDSVQLVMYAENLGTIPPNTGLLVVKDGKDIYEIRFSGDLQKNAAIIFKRKKQ